LKVYSNCRTSGETSTH